MSDAEIHELDLAVPLDHDIARLDVAVDEPAHMSIIQGIADLDGDHGPHIDRQCPGFLDDVGKVGPVNVFHHNAVGRFVPVIVDVDDVLVLERSSDPAFALETLDDLSIMMIGLFQLLDGHRPAEGLLDSLVHRGHAPGPDLSQYFIFIFYLQSRH
jgi:hypothetical protein